MLYLSKLFTFTALLIFTLAGCRSDPSVTQALNTNCFGGSGSGCTAQCSGWYPDWISENPPPQDVDSFQLAQGFWLGIPVFESNELVRFDPPQPTANPPWFAHDFHQNPQRLAYLSKIKNYAFAGMTTVDFVAQKNKTRRWYHVPMMTTSPTARREPYHGVTKERLLRANEHAWIQNSSNGLRSFAIAYYNALGSYTLGQVFNNPDPTMSDPTKALFIDGTMVFKILFAEYDPSKIVPGTDPLEGSPEWEVQDVTTPDAPLVKVRLLQVDIAVKDPRASQTGWVFATYVYDKSLIGSVSDPWHRLTPVGLQWGNDPDVTASGVGTVDESWINPAVPTIYGSVFGRHGRLNGPVDNPQSSCMSCHSTAQMVAGVTRGGTTYNDFTRVSMVPPGSCTNAQDMLWFRNIPAGVPFGAMSTTDSCVAATSAVSTPPLHSLDYSLQLQVGLGASLYYENANPCAALIAANSNASMDKKAAMKKSKSDGAEIYERDFAVQTRPNQRFKIQKSDISKQPVEPEFEQR